MIIKADYVKSLLLPLNDNLNKYSAGSVMMFAGSFGMAGAAMLSSKAALRSGAGFVRLVMPESIYSVCTLAVPEVVCSPVVELNGAVTERTFDSVKHFISKASAIAIGPGMGQGAGVEATLVKLLTENTKPLIIDADGINVLSQHIDLLKYKECPVVLTPHEGEMARLTGESVEYIHLNRVGAAAEFSEKHGVTLLLKGNATVISSMGMTMINPTGNAGLATAGSGDVLTGVISAFLSSGMSPFDAACAGAYIHGLSGDLAACALGERSLIASDIIEYLPKAFKEC